MNHHHRGMKLLGETALVVALGMVIGLVANTVSGRGLGITRNHFPPPPLPPSDTAVGGEVPSDAGTRARSAEATFRVMDHERAVAVFQGEAYLEERAIFIDARDDKHYADGHIPGAYQFDHYRPEAYLETVLSASRQAEMIVVYCNGGECEDSKLAVGDLIQQGVTPAKLNVYVGGVEEWQEAGMPCERGARLSDDIVYLDSEAEE